MAMWASPVVLLAGGLRDLRERLLQPGYLPLQGRLRDAILGDFPRKRRELLSVTGSPRMAKQRVIRNRGSRLSPRKPMAGPNTSSPLRSQQCESLRENGGEMTSAGLKEVLESGCIRKEEYYSARAGRPDKRGHHRYCKGNKVLLSGGRYYRSRALAQAVAQAYPQGSPYTLQSSSP